ncbi:molybdopterin-guanine dinucleotide biosynthesis protein B [Paenalcaligenes niemegkensis]|uniref:molybdopterin-guanine dinucleotide biosynthesis protein B n=1 Tax=Paenalcaligenes niemegkensis TaxID=2895469 RepID=UPI001EE8FE99|nr:molybdopterin-guanine dinucleotide biosynthesis protein B [Paenalcaligenes niemegkensis]MCQ9615515.1 molybdopterin-guanine dinucleotide biosynthesis protein B [Paenalcaligenes niemegkensis]
MQQVFGVIGKSGSGKTTLIEAMLPWFAQRKLQTAVIKHSHHQLSFEPPHKDSARFRAAGAREVIVASPYQYAVFHSLHEQPEPSLFELVGRLSPVDLVLVEGYRQADVPRIEVHRPSRGIDPVYKENQGVIAIVTDDEVIDCPLPQLDLNSPDSVAEFIAVHLQLKL